MATTPPGRPPVKPNDYVKNLKRGRWGGIELNESRETKMSRLSIRGAGASCGARACPQVLAEEPAFCQLGPQARVGGARAGAAAAAVNIWSRSRSSPQWAPCEVIDDQAEACIDPRTLLHVQIYEEKASTGE